MEIILSILFGLCIIAAGVFLIERFFAGAGYLLDCASGLGFIGEIAYCLAWIFFFPIMAAASLICGFLR